MRKELLSILFFILFIQVLHADFSSFYDSTMGDLEDEGRDFVAGGVSGYHGVRTTFSSVYQAFGTETCEAEWGSGGGTEIIIGLWLMPAIVIAMIVAFGVACIYMIGQFMGSPQLIAIAKDEGFQTGMSVLRVVFIILAVSAGNVWYGFSSSGTSDPVYSNNPLMIDASMAFARLMVNDMVNHYSVLLLYNMVIHTLYSSTMWFGITWRAMYSFNLGAVLKPIIDIVGTALQYLSLGMSTWLLHLVTLCLIKKWMWSLFIPLAFLLRAFPFTRNAGEALFALAISLAIFYPFMFLFDYEVHKLMKYNITDAKTAMGNFIQNSGIFSVFAPLIVIMLLMAGVFIPFFLGSALTLALELVKGAVYYIVIISLLLPFINIFVTLTAAKETAQFFRVDVNFMSFLKII